MARKVAILAVSVAAEVPSRSSGQTAPHVERGTAPRRHLPVDHPIRAPVHQRTHAVPHLARVGGLRSPLPFRQTYLPTFGAAAQSGRMDETYDVVVIGGGAAGLSGAVALARSRRSVLVVDAGDPRNAPAGHVHNFLSRDGTPPAELYAAGRDEVTRYGGRVETRRVPPLNQDGARFGVQIRSRPLAAPRLLGAP